MNRTRRLGAVCAAGALAAGALSACGSSSTSGSGGATAAPPASGSTRGQTINVAIAYPAPKALLKQFTAQTGIKVNWNYLQFDDLQTKIASAAQANSYFADVADVGLVQGRRVLPDGEWFLPLNRYFNPAQIKGQYPQLGSFRPQRHAGRNADGRLAAGHHGQPEGLQGRGRQHDSLHARPVHR